MIDTPPLPPPAIVQPAGQRARDGEIAVREEFDAARAKNTLAAWELFIARHPASPLIPEAVRLRGLLLGR